MNLSYFASQIFLVINNIAIVRKQISEHNMTLNKSKPGDNIPKSTLLPIIKNVNYLYFHLIIVNDIVILRTHYSRHHMSSKLNIGNT